MDAVRHGAGGRTLELVRLDGREEGEGYEANGEELHLCGIRVVISFVCEQLFRAWRLDR